MMGIRVPSDPHLHRWMMFVDGENFTLRAQRVAESENIPLQDGAYYMRDVLVWLPERNATTNLLTPGEDGFTDLQPRGVRSYYYTSTTGGEDVVRTIKERLWKAGFHPEVFKKARTRDKTKGVDLALATDLLSNAFRDNYDAAVLIAGDGDYLPLVEEVKRLGKVVHVAFFRGEGSGLSPNLRLASDWFWDLGTVFTGLWRDYDPEEQP